MKCQTCNGKGWVEETTTSPECCGGSETGECGGSGCNGPEPMPEQVQHECPDCYGSGEAAGSLKWCIAKSLKELDANSDVMLIARATLRDAQKEIEGLSHDVKLAEANFGKQYEQSMELAEENAHLRGVLQEHHDWQLNQGDVWHPDSGGDFVSFDGGAEYSDSELYEKTAESLSSEYFPWKSIETAPKDGKPILVGWVGYVPEMGHWDCGSSQWVHWTWQQLPCGPDGLTPSPFEEIPTHWMPLPNGPVTPTEPTFEGVLQEGEGV